MTETVGYPCSLLIWDKDGYHKCSARPFFDKGILKDFCCCAYVSEMALGDAAGYKFREETISRYCAKKYTWKLMESKVGPSIELALKQRGESRCTR